MVIKQINEFEFENFVNKCNQQSFYQSVSWMNFKKEENKECELLGLFKEDTLVGVSLIVYTKVKKFFKMAYASRGFIYDYSDIKEFKDALIKYLKSKKVVFFRMDPLVILAKYNPKMEKTFYNESENIITGLKENGFIHFGYNMSYETTQFRFIHRLELKNDFSNRLLDMNKSTRKNIESANFRGVRVKEVGNEELDNVLHFFDLTMNRKSFSGLSKNFYERLIKNFGDSIKLYITYVDKSIYLDNLKEQISSLNRELMELEEKKKHDNIGSKIRNQEMIVNNSIEKYNNEIIEAKNMDEYTPIASLVTIDKYDEVVAFASGMNNDYRKFNPKYAFYPEMIKYAIDKNKKYVNFLGVKNIFDKEDKDYGIYEVKRGFGGETIEYIGEFDLPINVKLYKIYQLIEKR